MAKFKKVPTGQEEYQWQFNCAGCGYTHAITETIHWFNQDVNKPTLTLSVLYRSGNICCHSYIKEGKIEYLSDCTHQLKGQTIELPEIN